MTSATSAPFTIEDPTYGVIAANADDSQPATLPAGDQVQRKLQITTLTGGPDAALRGHRGPGRRHGERRRRSRPGNGVDLGEHRPPAQPLGRAAHERHRDAHAASAVQRLRAELVDHREVHRGLQRRRRHRARSGADRAAHGAHGRLLAELRDAAGRCTDRAGHHEHAVQRAGRIAGGRRGARHLGSARHVVDGSDHRGARDQPGRRGPERHDDGRRHRRRGLVQPVDRTAGQRLHAERDRRRRDDGARRRRSASRRPRPCAPRTSTARRRFRSPAASRS